MPKPRPQTEAYRSLLEPQIAAQKRRKRICCGVALFLLFVALALTAGYLFWRYYWRPALRRQSPIDIVQSRAVYDESLGDGGFVFNYHTKQDVTLKNTGHGWMMSLHDDKHSNMTAVHLPGTFKLVQIHAHWDLGPSNGSEHTVDGMGFIGEIHFVHYNLKYASVGEALLHKDGLAVLGVFLTNDVIENYNMESSPLQQVAEKLYRIQNPNATTILDRIDVQMLIPNINEFWTYEGSLTTKPFFECVIWTVFRNPLPISDYQIDKFRLLSSRPHDEETVDLSQDDHEDDISGFVRYTQPLNGRPVRASFKHMKPKSS